MHHHANTRLCATNPVSPLIPKRIALFTGAYTHIADGVSLTLNRLVSHLESRGNEVLVIAPEKPVPAIPSSPGRIVPTRSFPMPGRPFWAL